MCNVTKVNTKVDVDFGSSFQDQYIKIISIKLDPKFTSALALTLVTLHTSFTIMGLIVFFIYTYLNHVSNLPNLGLLLFAIFLLNYIIKIHPFSRIIGGFI